MSAAAVTAVTAAAPPRAIRVRRALSDSLVIARRNLAHIRQIPEKLIDVTVQPLMFVVLFAYVFGGAIAVPGGGDYHAYLMGGIFVQTLVFGIVGPATAMATDLGEGVLDRFRSLPMARSAFIVGRVLAELAAALIALVVMTAAGLVVGWRIDADLPHALAGFGLLALIAFTGLWLGMLLGIIARAPDAVTGIAFMVIFPLTFVANAFVPTATLPGAVRAIAEWNPVSAMVAAVRTLFGNPTATPADAPWPLLHPVAASVGWCVALLAIAIPLAIAGYRRRTEL
jgi:ABC-2 type transport system permease protein